MKCGSVFHVIWNQERKLKGFSEEDCYDTDNAIKVSVEAIRHMIAGK